MANLNIGIVTSIWSVGPFMTALIDRILFGTKIKWSMIGSISLMMVATMLISISDIVYGPSSVQEDSD